MTTTFKLYTDSALTLEDDGVTESDQLFDGSSDPNQFVLYLGSTDDTRELRNAVNPGTDPITANVEYVDEAWQATTAYSLDDETRTTAKLRKRYKCTTAGTTGGSEPDWAADAPDEGDTVADGTVVWTNVGHQSEDDEVGVFTSSALALAATFPDTGDKSIDLPAVISGGVAGAQAIYFAVDDQDGGVVWDQHLKIAVSACVEYPAAP